MGEEQVDQILRIICDSFAMKSANVDLDLALLVINLREETIAWSEQLEKMKKEKKLTLILPPSVKGACLKL